MDNYFEVQFTEQVTLLGSACSTTDKCTSECQVSNSYRNTDSCTSQSLVSTGVFKWYKYIHAITTSLVVISIQLIRVISHLVITAGKVVVCQSYWR